MTYTVSLEQDSDGDLILPFDDEMLAELGWKEGDVLMLSVNDDGTYSITKYENSDSQ